MNIDNISNHLFAIKSGSQTLCRIQVNRSSTYYIEDTRRGLVKTLTRDEYLTLLQLSEFDNV